MSRPDRQFPATTWRLALGRWPLRSAIILGGIYLAWVAFLWATQERMIFPGADRPPPAATGPVDSGVEQVWFPTDDGDHVEAWYKPGRGRSAASPGPAAVYFHGNGDLLDTRWSVVESYLDEGISGGMIEYRGYGRSGGRPSQDAIVSDAVGFCDWLKARPEVDPARIVFHGLSLGGGVAAAVAEQRRPAALILECTFTSMSELAWRYGVPSFLCRNPFETDRVLPALGVPILIIHGRADTLIPIDHARRLHAIAPGSRLIELPCGHGDYRSDPATIRDFLGGVALLPGR